MVKTLKNIAMLLFVAVVTSLVSCKNKETCYLNFPVTVTFGGKKSVCYKRYSLYRCERP